MKVIIWGYPLNSHTHSFVHYGWHKAFTHLGHETYWFHDKEYPKDFDYTNTLFITEGYADENIPLHKSNTYCVHVARNPYKYIDVGARFIDLRYNVTSINDCNYKYDLSFKNLIPVSDVTLYEPKSSNRDLHSKYQKENTVYYEAVYVAWATDLLPHEINLENRFLESEKVVYFIGSVSGGNGREISKFAEGCSKRGIKVLFNDPWKNPLSFEEAQRLVQKSIIAPDIRGSGDRSKPNETGTCHKQIGYIPCRLFKNISYGKLGATNCKRLKDLFGGYVVYCEDEDALVEECLKHWDNVEYIKTQMEWVRDNHTFINRVQDLMSVILM